MKPEFDSRTSLSNHHHHPGGGADVTAPKAENPSISQSDSSMPSGAARIDRIWSALRQVTDPEIPVLDIVDMGLVAKVRAVQEQVIVEITPTFVGCPALDLIRSEISRSLRDIGELHVQIKTVFSPPWTSDRMSEAGRRKLKEFGLAPPARDGDAHCSGQSNVPCPYCGSTRTELESMFGPTLCRSIHYCHQCLQSFEHFKTV